LNVENIGGFCCVCPDFSVVGLDDLLGNRQTQSIASGTGSCLINTIKPLEELFGMYEASIGHGSNFLLNVGPDNHGLICKADFNRLLELGKKIRESYSAPNEFSKIEQNGNEYSIAHADFYKAKPDPTVGLTNRVVICEDMTDGQSVQAFNVYAHLPFYKHKRILVYSGYTIGNKLICQIPAIRTPKITVEITQSDGNHKITEIKTYFVK
jgi:alpha-L-fucosidase